MRRASGVIEALARSGRCAPVRAPVWIVLVETARRWPHVADTICPWITAAPELLVECGGSVIARAATVAQLAPSLPSLGRSLDNTIGAGRHTGLDPGAVVVQEQVVEQARAGTDRTRIADALTTLGVRLASVGRRPEALAAAEEAVGHCRELVAGNRAAYLPNLAVSVNNLAIQLAEAGRREEGLAAAEEAVRLRRELVAGNRAAYLPNLATAVNNLALRLAEAGQRAEGLAAAEEAADHFTTLAERYPAVFASRSERAIALVARLRDSLTD